MNDTGERSNAMNELRVRIVSADHYLCEPITQIDDHFSEFRQKPINRVPVIRIYGTTTQGLKACVHVHRVYPYLSIPYHDFDNSVNDNKRAANLRKFANDLDNQLIPSRVQTRKRLSNDSLTHQQVFKIEDLDAIPFYGYHDNSEKFMRIYFYNPAIVQTASEQLLNGFIMNRSIQPHEAHIPYILQFFIDNNLYGMNFMNIKNVRYRKTKQHYDNFNYINVEPISSCDIECDINYEDIINRQQNDQKRNPGLKAIWNEQMSRCKDSQEFRNLIGVPSQERASNDVFAAESFHFDRLYKGLRALNINIDGNSSSSQSHSTGISNSDEFAKMIVHCIRANNDDNSDDSDDSISREMSQKLEDIVNISKSRKVLKNNSNYESSDDDSDSTVIEEFDEINENQSRSYCSDAYTQTEIRCNLDDSIDSLLSYVNDNNNQNDNEDEDIEEVLCDCDSDECCDHCCDRRSDQCECDCERCEFDKFKRIPQLDGAYDEDESDVQSAFNDDSNDSDFEVSKKKSSPKKKAPAKRSTKSKRLSPVKRKKFSQNSDSSDMEFTNTSSSFIISKPGPASSKRRAEATTSSFSITSISPNDDFDSKANKISSKLFDKIKSTDAVSKKKESDSPIHMSFSDSETSNVSKHSKSDIGTPFISITNTRKSRSRTKNTRNVQKSPDSRSDRSPTPYFSNESDAEMTSKPGPKSSKNGSTKPGPKSSKTSTISRPGPKSSKLALTAKPGPKSSKLDSTTKPVANSRPGPKSSKTSAKSGPKSSKSVYEETSESEVLSDPYDNAVTTRTRRSLAKPDGSSTGNFSLEFIANIGKAKPSKRKLSPVITDPVVDKDSSILSNEKNVPPIKRATYRRSLSFQTITNVDSADLEWKSFNDDCVQLDLKYYNEEHFNLIGTEELICKKIPENVIEDFVDNYWNHMNYFNDVKSEIRVLDPSLLISGYNSKTAHQTNASKSKTRSKGALKDFYTLPHLNKNEKRAKVQKSVSKSKEVERLLSDIPIEKSTRSSSGRRSGSAPQQSSKNKPVSKISSQTVRNIPKVTPKSVKAKYLPKKSVNRPKRLIATISASNSKRVTQKRVPQQKQERILRPKRGVTSSTLFTTTSIAFQESDIYVATDLKGAKKLEYLKSLCNKFDVHIFSNQLENDFVHDFMSTRPQYKEYYYNHYNGYLSDDESDFADDIKKTVRYLVNTVVSAEFALECAINQVDLQLREEERANEMVDTRDDEFLHEDSEVPDEWNYGHYADDDYDVGINVDEGIVENEENHFEKQSDIPVDDEMPINDEMDCDDNEQQRQEQQDIDQNSDCGESGRVSNDGFNESDERDLKSDREDNSNECVAEKNGIYYESEEQHESEAICETYDIGTQAASEEFSPSSEHSEQFSNNVNNGDNIYGDGYNVQESSLQSEITPEVRYADEEEENAEEDEYEDCVSAQQSGQQNNMPIDMSNITITASHPELHSISTQETQFKLDSNYNPELYSSVNYHISSSAQPYQPIQNIASVPIMTSHTHFAPQTVYPQPTQNWPQAMQMPMNVNVVPINELSYNIAQNMPNVGNNSAMNSQSQETEFDVSNFSYDMYHYQNHNIPQFDGIFDDDSFNSEGNQFNINCSQQSFNIEPLGQGSRSEEAAVTDPIRSSKRDAHLDSLDTDETDTNERYGKIINGVVVYIPKSIPDAMLRKIGREIIVLDRLKTCQDRTTSYNYKQHQYEYINNCYFNEIDAKMFYKTSLIGAEKFIHLQSMCKPLSVKLLRLDSHYKSSNFILNDYKTSNYLISPFSNKYFINKNRCVENTDNNNLISSPLICSSAANVNQLFMSPIISTVVNQTQTNCETTKNEIYSFYLDDSNHSSSPKSLSQSTNISTESNRSSINSEIVNKNIFKRHSTPLANKNRRHIRDNLHSTDKSNELLSDISEETVKECVETVKNCGNSPRARRHHSFDSVIDGPSLSNTYNFEISSVNTDCAAINDIDNDCQYLTTMSVELHISTRDNLNPDPQFDNIETLFYSVMNDVPVSSQTSHSITGLIVVVHDLQAFVCDDDVSDSQSKNRYLRRFGLPSKDILIEYAANEIDLLMRFVDVVKRFDPDIIVGYDLRSYSWGFILQRADILNINIITPLSRINEEKYAQNVDYVINKDGPQLSGRISLNLWSIIRHECSLNIYSYENIHYHVLHERIPNYQFSTLNEWYGNYKNHMNRYRVLEYYLIRVKGCLRILDKLDFINRNSELARLFGIQFSEVFNRGSQFRVESMMLRLTKQFNYVAVSPHPKQRASMKAPEFIPLTLEPESNYYTDPVAVLDFQSLYPSMIIAYNYCYSTSLGTVDNLISYSDDFNFGCTSLVVPKNNLIKYQNDIHISPNGVVFLKSNIRRGILPQMLEDILNTRIMVKNAIKANNKKDVPNKSLHRKLDARQLGLKLIANVTYGYTSANFSGRMPCVEIADAIVSKGRETLERAIKLVNNEPKWGGKVIYGDTDSLFVLFPGCTKEEAFKRAQDIAEVVTEHNPKPVKLRFEKIYLPCVLQTKKRYAGFMYESVDQNVPVFDAKGIETVRRDTCPAVAKMLEKSLRILFTTNDVTAVKMYIERQFHKILEGRVSILNDFIFAREYRGKDNYSSKACVPSVDIAKKRLMADPRSEPKVGERVPYVVVYGEPNQPVIKLVKEPLELIRDPTLRLNAIYYIERVIIPPLNRVFQLIGHDVMKWYNQMPRNTGINRNLYLYGKQIKSNKTIRQYFNSTKCVVCGNNAKHKHLCDNCGQSQQNTAISICDKIRDIHNKHSAITLMCMSCNGISDNQLKCVSIDCPNMFRYHQSKLDVLNISHLNDILSKF